MGLYYPSMIVSNSTGCQNQIFLDTITVTDNTVYIDDIGDFSVCPNDSIEVNIVTNGNSISWMPSVGVQDPNSANTFIKPISTTTYVLSVEDGNCMNKDTIHVNVHPAVPQASVSSNNPLCETLLLHYQKMCLLMSHIKKNGKFFQLIIMKTLSFYSQMLGFTHSS